MKNELISGKLCLGKRSPFSGPGKITVQFKKLRNITYSSCELFIPYTCRSLTTFDLGSFVQPKIIPKQVTNHRIAIEYFLLKTEKSSWLQQAAGLVSADRSKWEVTYGKPAPINVPKK